MKKINVRSPFFITVQKETAKVDPNDDCIRDANGLCIDEDPCIATPTLPQCPVDEIDPVFQDRNLICGDTSVNIPVSGAVVYNFDIDTSGRDNGDYTVTLNKINIPVRIRMDVLANVPKTDLSTGTAFENKGLTSHDTSFLRAGYTATGLTASGTNSDGLNITKTFAYNSSSHTGNLRFQLHLPVLTDNDMNISVSCPAKTTVTTVPDSVVTIVSFTSLNVLNNLSQTNMFRPSVKLNGVELGEVINGVGEIMQKDHPSLTNELLFQSDLNTIMGVGRYTNRHDQYIYTRRFIQAASDSGAEGTGLKPIGDLAMTGTFTTGLPTIRNREFFGNIPNGVVASESVRTFSSTFRNTRVTYSGNNFLPDGINTIEVLLPTGLPDGLPSERLHFQISISRHTVKSFGSPVSPTGLYIADPPSVGGLYTGDAKALVVQGIMVGPLSQFTFDFKGNNNTELFFDQNAYRCEISNPHIENLNGAGIDTTGFTDYEQVQDLNPLSLSIQQITL